MIYQTICNGIQQNGTDCVLTEYKNHKKHVLRGIVQPIGIKSKDYSQADYTHQGKIDNSEFLFIFNVPKENINFENAVLWVECKDLKKNYYWIKNCKPFYYKDKPIYFSAIIQPCVGEVVF